MGLVDADVWNRIHKQRWIRSDDDIHHESFCRVQSKLTVRYVRCIRASGPNRSAHLQLLILYPDIPRVAPNFHLHSVHSIIHINRAFNSLFEPRRCCTPMCDSRLHPTSAWPLNRRGYNPRLLKSPSSGTHLLIRYWFWSVDFFLHFYCPNAIGNVHYVTRFVFDPSGACHSFFPFLRVD